MTGSPNFPKEEKIVKKTISIRKYLISIHLPKFFFFLLFVELQHECIALVIIDRQYVGDPYLEGSQEMPGLSIEIIMMY